MLGYIRNKPDLIWWTEQIQQGIKYRSACTNEPDWPRYRSYYRQDYKSGILPKNIFFEILQLLVPRLYFRNPAVSVMSNDGTLEGLIISKIVERTTNKLFRMMNIKNTMQSMLMTSFFTATSIGKFGFGGIHAPTPNAFDNMLPVDKNGLPVSFSAGCSSNFPWFKKVPTNRFSVPHGTSDTGDNKWYECMEYYRSYDELKRDPIYSNTNNMAPEVQMDEDSAIIGTEPDTMARNVDRIKLYEVRDRRNHTVFTFAPEVDKGNGGRLLYFGDDSLQDDFSSCYLSFTYNKDDERWWGIPYAKLIEPIQIEMNSIKDQKLRHMYLSIIKFIYSKGAFDEKDLKNLVSSKTGIGIELLKGSAKNAINPLTTGGTPIDFDKMMIELYNDLRQLVGLSRNASGDPIVDKSHSNTTAEEIRVLRQSSDLRLDSNRDQIADLLVNLARLTHSVIFKHWNQDMVANIAGENRVPIWVRFNANLISNTRFKLTVDPDTALPRTRDLRQQEIIQLYTLLAQDPQVNHEAIVRKLLHEFIGVDYEEYMNSGMQPQLVPGAAQDIGGTARNLANTSPQFIQQQLLAA
jgi:hypothetical protein